MKTSTASFTRQRLESCERLLDAIEKRHRLTGADRHFLVIGLRLGYRAGHSNAIAQIKEMVRESKRGKK